MDLLNKINNRLVMELGYKKLSEEEIISFVLQTAKQRLYNKSYNKTKGAKIKDYDRLMFEYAELKKKQMEEEEAMTPFHTSEEE